MQTMQHGFQGMLEYLLQRGRHVLVLRFDCRVRLAWRTKAPNELVRVEGAERGRAICPRHLHAFALVAEVIKVQLEAAIRLHMHDVMQSANIRRTVTREAHDFAFVAETGKPEPL